MANGGQDLHLSRDTLSRPIGLTDEAEAELVSDVEYEGPSGQFSKVSYGLYGETLACNVRGQLTRLTAKIGLDAKVDLEYLFSATNNDGRLTQIGDSSEGER